MVPGLCVADLKAGSYRVLASAKYGQYQSVKLNRTFITPTNYVASVKSEAYTAASDMGLEQKHDRRGLSLRT
jgi:hypothetical protein